MKIIITDSISSDLKDLFWNVFFKSKNRGISLERHFPWIDNSLKDVVFFEAKVSSVTVGGLVLRKTKFNISEKEYEIGMIGLVCVSTTNRGAGIATELLTKTIDFSKEKNYDYLTLWTNQHRIYSKHNFYVSDPWHYGWIQTEKCVEYFKCNEIYISKSVSEIKSSPLPPFATGIYKHSIGEISFILIKDSDGDIIVSHEGNTEDLALFMIHSLPERWRLNAVKNDPLISALTKQGASVKLSPVNLQMWLNLNDGNNLNSILEEITIPVLYRI